LISVGFGWFSVFHRKKQSNSATKRERVVEQIRTIEKEQLPTIFVQQFTHKFQHKIENILNKQKGLNRQIYHCYTITGATICLIVLEIFEILKSKLNRNQGKPIETQNFSWFQLVHLVFQFERTSLSHDV